MGLQGSKYFLKQFTNYFHYIWQGFPKKGEDFTPFVPLSLRRRGGSVSKRGAPPLLSQGEAEAEAEFPHLFKDRENVQDAGQTLNQVIKRAPPA